jgi:hypothetical protein
MKKAIFFITAAAVLFFSIGPVTAALEIGRPGELPTGYLYMTPQEAHDEVVELIEAGELDSSAVTFYNGIVLSGTPAPILIRAGVYYEHYLSRFDTILRYDDPFWAEPSPIPHLSEWQYAWLLSQ